jgi:hypothetical protein
MHLESIPELGAHSRELSVCSGAWRSESFKGDSPTLAGEVDAVAAAEEAIELSGEMAAAASGESRKWTSAANAKYHAMQLPSRIAAAVIGGSDAVGTGVITS